MGESELLDMMIAERVQRQHPGHEAYQQPVTAEKEHCLTPWHRRTGSVLFSVLLVAISIFFRGVGNGVFPPP